MTMTLVQTVTVGAGGAASIEFTGIPQTGTDLLVVVSARSTQESVSSGNVYAQFNNDTGNNYSGKYLVGTGSSVVSSSAIQNGVYVAKATGNATTGSTFGSGAAYIANYASSTTKSISADGVGENNSTSSDQIIVASKWTGTSGITSIKLLDFWGGSFMQYSTASLYTITKGSGGATVS